MKFYKQKTKTDMLKKKCPKKWNKHRIKKRKKI